MLKKHKFIGLFSTSIAILLLFPEIIVMCDVISGCACFVCVVIEI